MSKAEDILSRYDRLRSKRASFYDAAWRSSAEWLMPRKSSLLGQEKTAGESGWVDNLFDTTGQTANERLAAWLMTNTSPANGRWFAFTTPPQVRNAIGQNVRVDQWWQAVTEITLEQLATSNFYTEKHESLLDRNTFGTCCLFTKRGKKIGLNFRAIEVASYVIAASDEGSIDTVMREFKLTVRQAVQQFGVESLGRQMSEAWASDSSAQKDKEFTFIHSVAPNADRMPGYDDIGNKAWSSCYVCKEDKHIVQEGGFDEMPYAVSRFLKWTGDEYGWAPAFTALPVVRETNFFKMQMEALAELAAFPPVIEPDNLAGQIDMRAGGRTVVAAQDIAQNILPRPLFGATGRFDIGKDLIAENREFINQCFYGDIVAMFSNLEREVTAFEASQLAGEKLDVFSPYYHRLINELDTPTLQRVFSILLEGGYYPEVPQELLEISADGQSANIASPEVTYLSRLALAIQAHQIGGFDALMQRAQVLGSIDPSLAAQFLSNYDIDRAARGIGRNLGVPVDWQKDPEQQAAERQAQAEAAQQQAMAEAAPGVAKAAKDVDGMSGAGQNRLAEALGRN